RRRGTPARPPPMEKSPFSDVDDFAPLPSEVPMASIEIPLPEGILSSLPDLGAAPAAAAVSSVAAPPKPVERRSTDGLVKEVTVPLNLSVEELRQHRRLRLKITVDINLLG
ncbi:MAG TPA: hypothetical protein VI670_16575, partial [Thermoanaerobaculia bacterium]